MALAKTPTMKKCIVVQADRAAGGRCRRAGMSGITRLMAGGGSPDCPAEELDSEHLLLHPLHLGHDGQAQGGGAHDGAGICWGRI